MTGLYIWLKFFHLLGLAAFLIAHGVSGGASLALRAPVSAQSRRLLRLSQRSAIISNPSLLLVIVSGVWMAFAGHWWGQGWLWAAVAVLVGLVGTMAFIARPYNLARDAAKQPDDVLAVRLSRTRPLAAIWVGGLGLVVLLGLMVFKPF